MALTPEFMTAVRKNNLMRVRIMLKDSLLVDKRFVQFTEMRQYAERMGVNFWMEKTEELEMKPQESWNADLMNLELTKLVNDFTTRLPDRLSSFWALMSGIRSLFFTKIRFILMLK